MTIFMWYAAAFALLGAFAGLVFADPLQRQTAKRLIGRLLLRSPEDKGCDGTR